MNFRDMMLGRKGKMEQHSIMDPQQIGAVTSFLNQAQQGMQNPYAGFEPIENRARSQFQQSIPSLAERFTALSPSAQRSSGFQSALGRAQSGLEESLAAMKSQYGLQNRGQMMQLAQMGLQPRFENIYRPQTQGLLGEMAGPLLMALLSGGMGAGISGGMFGRSMMNQARSGQGMGAMMPWAMMGGMGGQ